MCQTTNANECKLLTHGMQIKANSLHFPQIPKKLNTTKIVAAVARRLLADVSTPQSLLKVGRWVRYYYLTTTESTRLFFASGWAVLRTFDPNDFDWRRARHTMFMWFFSWYRETHIVLERRPELRGLMTEWMSAEELAKIVKQGDLVEFNGTKSGLKMFHHWSVCVRSAAPDGSRSMNDVRLLHMSLGTTKKMCGEMYFKCGFQFVDAKVDIRTLSETRQILTHQCRINNALDLWWKPYSGTEITRHALAWKNGCRYNGTFFNCEHFAKMCRYGHAEGVQSEMIVTFCNFWLHVFSLLFLPFATWFRIFFLMTQIWLWYRFGLFMWRYLESQVFRYLRAKRIPLNAMSPELLCEKIPTSQWVRYFGLWLATMGFRLLTMRLGKAYTDDEWFFDWIKRW